MALGGSHDCVLFDMDGTLLDTERVSLRAWEQSLARYGIDLDPVWYLNLIGRDWPSCESIVTDSFGGCVDTAALAKTLRQTYEQLLSTEGVPLRDGAEALLDPLATEGVPLGVATSTATALAQHKLERAGLGSFFDVVIGGDRVRSGKPAPDIYLLAANAMGHAPERCVAVEDSTNGFLAAHRAGMTTLLVPDLVEPTVEVLDRAHAVAHRLEDALPLLTAWLRPTAAAAPSRRG